MDLTDIQCFLAVAREEQFARAAEGLHFNPSYLSRRVRRLEAELGGALFDRTTHEVRLSKLGALLLPDAMLVMETVGRIRSRSNEFSTNGKRLLKIGYIGVYHVEAMALI